MDKRLFAEIEKQMKELLRKNGAKVSEYKFKNERRQHISVYINEDAVVIHICKYKKEEIYKRTLGWEKYKRKILEQLHCVCEECRSLNRGIGQELDVRHIRDKYIQPERESVNRLRREETNNDTKLIKATEAERIRVIYLVNSIVSMNICGYTIRTHELVKSLQKREIDVVVLNKLYMTRGGMKEKDGVKYARLGTEKKIRMYKDAIMNSKEYIREYAKELEKYCEHYKPDIIHACSNYINPLVGSIVGKKLGIPCIYEVRGFWDLTRLAYDPEWETTDSFEEYGKAEEMCYKKSDHIFALNGQIKREIESLLANEHTNKITVIKNAVNIEKWRPKRRNEGLRRKLRLTEIELVIGYIGSIVEYEGIEVLVKAVTELKNKCKKCKLLIIGGGNTTNAKQTMIELKELIARLRMGRYISLVGQVDYIDIKQYYSVIDVICIPRRGERVCELVTPIKIFEAMSMEKAVIVSDVQPLQEIITHGETGLIFKKGNSNDLAKKIMRIYEDKTLMKELGAEARKYVKKNNNWKDITKKIYRVYKELIPK